MTTLKQTALVTGASGGIGYELSRILAAEGYNLVLVARSVPKLNDLAAELTKSHGVAVTILAKDLSEPDAPGEVFAALQQQGITVDVLVNNAGFGVNGLFAQSNLTEQLQMMQLNMVSLTHLTGLLLPGMLERGFGRVLNVASTASFAAGPWMAVYCATKAYVLSFSEAISEEVRGSGVTVTTLCPGVTRTGFQERARVGQMRLLRGSNMSAREVAAIGYKAMIRGQVVVVAGFMNQLLAFSTRFTPRWLARRVGRYLMEQTHV